MADRTRCVLHADMDAYYVSVELRRRPELRGKPVVVGGSGRRGVVAAASYEARRYGVFSAMPSAVARRRCPHAVFLQGDHAHYAEVSAQVRAIFDRYSPAVEPLSLDEAFIDVTGTAATFSSGATIAEHIRTDIATELELSCSVGVAPNKFLAKLASVEAKPVATRDGVEPGPGVVVIEPGTEQQFLDPLPVDRLWGVGPKTHDKLRRLGITSVYDLRCVDPAALRASLGARQADHLRALAVGHDDRPVETDRQAKSISHEETYSYDKQSFDELDTELVRLADAVATRLREHEVAARTVGLKVRFSEFTTITRAVTVREGIDTAVEIVDALRPILADIDVALGVRLFGVTASNLVAPQRQLSFDDLGAPPVDTHRPRSAPHHLGGGLDGGPGGGPDGGLRGDSPVRRGSSERHRAATTALDQVRERFGADAIGPARLLDDKGLRSVQRGDQQWGPDAPNATVGDASDGDGDLHDKFGGAPR